MTARKVVRHGEVVTEVTAVPHISPETGPGHLPGLWVDSRGANVPDETYEKVLEMAQALSDAGYGGFKLEIYSRVTGVETDG